LGSYSTPAVRTGDRVTCLYRDAECVVTGVHDAPIPWPRCRARDARGGSGLWVDEALAAAVRTESAAALMHWFGVGPKAVWRWRKVLGAGGHAATPGTRAAVRAAAEAGGAGIRAKEWTDAELDARADLAKRLGLRPPPRWASGGWTAEQLALLGTAPDDEVAAAVGRSPTAVRVRRNRLGIPTFRDGRRG
jgi:hypothetical protein